MTNKRKQRRARGREKGQSVLRSRYPEHYFFKGPNRLSTYTPGELQSTLEFLIRFDECTKICTKSVLLDLHETKYIDATACVMLAAAIQRCQLGQNLHVDVRMPRNGSARFALKVFGVADDARAGDDVPEEIGEQVMKVTSGMKGDPSPGERTFEVARLAERLDTGETLADRVHGALNEAADNVLSWAYGMNASPDSTERWWVAGLLTDRSATFIALDHGAGIPTTAPQNLGDSLTGLIKTMMQDKGWRQINLKPTDSQILLATIHQRRTMSGLEERGKGLNNMIALIDRFSAGFINIFSGDAVYGYRTPAANEADKEHCTPLGFQFPGTLIVW
ncbi:hypothetical protein [Brevundimonas sp. TWP1-2-1b1]|uniref:hypothetical protein n=1 Tax=unclassified Brevundimonas TaxID=2622653 RepID=UPI003CF576CE